MGCHLGHICPGGIKALQLVMWAKLFLRRNKETLNTLRQYNAKF